MKDELYIDIVTKTIISKLSEEIVGTIGEPISELIKGLLLNELSNLISAKIKKETDFLIKTISETEDSSKLLINNSGRDIKRHIDEGLERHAGTEAELRTFIQGELNSFRQAFQTEDNYTSLKGLIENQLAGFTDKTKTLIENIRAASISNMERSGSELKRYLEENFEKQKRFTFEQNALIKDELSAIKQFAMDVLDSQIRQLESEAGAQSGRKTELEKKIRDLRALLKRAAGAGEKESA